ncbi:hypothetical protein BG262_02750 [Floricoccus penangensis]|uniref:Uncharacterized protein n=1 Tax=Floricoccus penangensis TaxID=1859475 RepID=A0A9Q5JGM6_9LACT|nr:hypothetical protein [Floricoccus penangensis]OFI46735.1 hypothetical protein BG262_02750 [Floricoccus penangensis]
MKFEFELYRATSKAKVPTWQKLIINSNDRMHYQQKAKVTKKLRHMAKLQAYEVSFGRTYEKFSKNKPCGVTLTVYTPTKRRSDPDNLQPTLKAIMDGFTEAELWADDNHDVVKYTKHQFGGLSGTDAYRLVVEIDEL